ncbi:SCO family protein [Alkalimarinus alittae]|uniref:SCO family protein n=1 Tax=Alkalimarinus alittae TaxID=2961619 RepID=A0ABY6MXQ8_9ALTE|nr:SCO family protein [Alkalimarinus alittae]UZE94611.1 SCO family protein [Alkalimarinus alittae]
MKLKLLIPILLLAILFAGVWSGLEIYNSDDQDPSKLKAAFLTGGDFKMTGGETKFELSDVKGKVVLLYFGFTSCPDVCPTGLSVIKSALRKLGDQADDINVLFITLDPERDTEQRLNEYLPFFDARIIGLNGTASELAAVAKQYGVYYKKVNSEESSTGYTVDHSANFFVIDQDGVLTYVLDHNVSSKTLAEMIRKVH